MKGETGNLKHINHLSSVFPIFLLLSLTCGASFLDLWIWIQVKFLGMETQGQGAGG